jgi:hypothetical protein
MVHDLITRLAGREHVWGVETAPLRDAHPFLAAYRDPEFVASLAGPPARATSATTWRWCRTRSGRSPPT